MGRAVSEMEKSCALMTAEEAEENLQCFRELASLYSKAGRDQELTVLEAEITRLGLSSAETTWVAAAVMAKWRSTVTAKTESTLVAPKADAWASDGSSVTPAARAAPANKHANAQQRHGVDRLPPSGFSRQEKHQTSTKAERALAEVEPVRRQLNEIVLALAHEQADASAQLRTLVEHLEAASEPKQLVGSLSASASSDDDHEAAAAVASANSNGALSVVSDSLEEHGVYTRAIVAQLLLEARRYLSVMEGVESGGWRNLEALSSSSSSSSRVDATLAIPGFQSWSDVVQVFRYCRLHAQTRLETDAAAQKSSAENSKRTSASRRPRRSSTLSSSAGSASASKKDASKEKKDAASKEGAVGRGSALGLWALVLLVVTAILNSRNNKKRSRFPTLAEVYTWCLSVVSCCYASWKDGTWRSEGKAKVVRAYSTTAAHVMVWLFRLSGGRFGALPIDELVAEEVQLQEKAAHKVKKEKERQEEAKRMKAANNKRHQGSKDAQSSSQHSSRSEASKSLRHRNNNTTNSSSMAAAALVENHSTSAKKSGFGEDFGDWVEDDDDSADFQQRAESMDQWIEASSGPNNRRRKGHGHQDVSAAASAPPSHTVHASSKASLPVKTAAAHTALKSGAPQAMKPPAPPSISTKAAAAQAVKPALSAPASKLAAAAPMKKKEVSSSLSWPSSSSSSSSAEPLAPSVASLFAVASSSSSSSTPDSPSCNAVGLSSPRTSNSSGLSEGEKVKEAGQYTNEAGTAVRPAHRDFSSMSDRSRSRSLDASSTSSRQSFSEGEGNTTTSATSSKDERATMSPEYMQQQQQMLLQQQHMMMVPPEMWAQHLEQPPLQMTPTVMDPSSPYATPEENDITAALRWQMEFYFSAQNLCRDMYLRGQMDPLGFVSLATCAQFNKMQQLLVAAGPRGPEFLFAALQTSNTLHVAVPWAMRASPGPHPYAAIFVSVCGWIYDDNDNDDASFCCLRYRCLPCVLLVLAISPLSPFFFHLLSP